MARLRLPEQQGVEGAGVTLEQRQQQPQRQHGEQDVGRLAGRQAPHLPQAQVAQHLIVGQVGEQANGGAREGGDGHPGQQHDGDRGAFFAGAEQVDQGGGERAAEKGQQGQHANTDGALQVSAERRQQYDGQRRPERGPARDADDAGVGQRIAKQALHHGAAQTEDPAHRDAEQGAWQADLLHHQLLVGGQGRARQQGAETLAKAEREWPGRQRKQAEQQQQASQGQQQRRQGQAAQCGHDSAHPIGDVAGLGQGAEGEAPQ